MNIREQFEKVIAATGKDFQLEQAMGGHYRLMIGDDIYHDDSACEDVYTEEDAMALYISMLLEDEVPADKKELKFGMWFLK